MTRLDSWLPNPDLSALHSIEIGAPPTRVYQALKVTDFGANPVVAAIMALRAIPALLASPVATWKKLRRQGRPANRAPTATLLDGAFTILEDVADEEIVLGITGRFWTPTGGLVPTQAEHFREPLLPGLAQAAWSFHCQALSPDTTRLATETRVRCADAATRRSFLRYWRVIAPGSGLIRWAILRQVRHRAELGVTLLCLVAASVRAQEPPSHFPVCTSDSAARAFLGRVQFLLSASDGRSRARLDSLALGAADPDRAMLIIDEPTCIAASEAYAAKAHPSTGLHPPFPVMIVRAGNRYLVQLGGVTGADGDRWEVVVFDLLFQPLASY